MDNEVNLSWFSPRSSSWNITNISHSYIY